MRNPRIEVDYEKLKLNVETIVGLCSRHGISVAGVSKAFGGDPAIARALVEGGCKYLADSRVENLIKLKGLGLPLMMLRLPMPSEALEVVRHSDISLNSELETIRALNKACGVQGIRHKVILMMDLGDLREGYYDEYELFDAIEDILKTMPLIEIAGVGVNLTCYGGIIPDEYNLFRLVTIGKYIKKKYQLDLELISGGNSSSLHLLLDDDMVDGINNLRIGEAFLLGRETAYGEKIPGTTSHIFQLVAEIIEIKAKPTLPQGIAGKNAFGEPPEFEDRGIRKLAICAIGRQDVDVSKLTPLDEAIMIMGASSDHIVLDLTDTGANYAVGSEVRFNMTYGGILSAMTSPYVHKKIVYKNDPEQSSQGVRPMEPTGQNQREVLMNNKVDQVIILSANLLEELKETPILKIRPNIKPKPEIEIEEKPQPDIVPLETPEPDIKPKISPQPDIDPVVEPEPEIKDRPNPTADPIVKLKVAVD